MIFQVEISLNLTLSDIMVYTEVIIVLGIKLTEEEAHDLFEITEEDYPVVRTKLLRCRKYVKIFEIPNEHEDGPRKYILGLKVHKYYHKVGFRCDKCEKYSLCDNCIGQTNNGVYDVRAMVTDSVEVNLRHVCLNCFADNKKDLGGRTEDIPIVGGKFAYMDKVEGLERCNTCGYKPDRNL